MLLTVTRQFVILSLHPEKGRLIIQNSTFRYSLIGAVLMDLLKSSEISMTNHRLIHSFRKNGEQVHDLIAERIERSSKPRRFSYWVRRLSMKSRFIYNDTINALVSNGMLRHEKRFFMNIIPYNRYFLNDKRVRNEIIEGLRGVLLYGKQATSEQMMLIGLLKASSAHSILAREREEKRILKKKCSELMEQDELSSEIDKAIREMRAAIASAVAVSAATSHGAY
jgi:hypothetical protein